jgi:hypothetical protein
MEMIEGFVKALEKSHDLVRTEISLSKEWSVTVPEELRETRLQDYLKRVSLIPQTPAFCILITPKTGLSVNMYLGYHNFDSFREGYLTKFGVKPYISPVQTSKWQVFVSLSGYKY